MRPVKKALKQLGNPELGGESHEDHLEHTRRCLLKIGDHINDLLAAVASAAELRDWRKYATLLLQLQQPFNGLFSRTTWVSRHQRGQYNLSCDEINVY